MRVFYAALLSNDDCGRQLGPVDQVSHQSVAHLISLGGVAL